MRWFKVAAILVGVMIAFLVVSSVVGFVVEAVIAVVAVAAIALAVKVAFHRGQVSWKKPSGQVREPRSSRPLGRHSTREADDELARLKREMGG
jgi:hypothetical protein